MVFPTILGNNFQHSCCFSTTALFAIEESENIYLNTLVQDLPSERQDGALQGYAKSTSAQITDSSLIGPK